LQLAVRGKNKKEVVESLWKRFTQSADEVLLSGQRDVDDFFEHERNYLVEYNTHIKDAATKAEKVVKLRKSEYLEEFKIFKTSLHFLSLLFSPVAFHHFYLHLRRF
ncbi:hypothetical protein OESDEN_23316, partial [Oesophagostomum dentatum]